MHIAKWIAATVAMIFIVSGIYQFLLMRPRPATLAVALVVSGIAILHGRSWGYYIAYIDDDPQVGNLIITQLNQRLFNR